MSKRSRSAASVRYSGYSGVGKKSRSASTHYARAGATRTGGLYVRAAMPGEKKYFDTRSAVAVNSATGVVSPSLNLIPQGTSASQRVGNKVTLRNINITLSSFAPISATLGQGDDVLRVILFVDHQCNGTAALPTDILETADYDSFRNMAKAERFTVLKDKLVTFSGLAGSASNSAQNPKMTKLSWKGERVLHFSPSAAGAAITVAGVRSDNIGLLLISEQGAAAATCSTGFNARIKFTD